MSTNSEPELPFQPRRLKEEEAELDITPMIDITFLLLSFFVVASKMDPAAAVDVPKAQYGDTVSEKNCVCVLVLPGDTPDTAKLFKGRSTEEKDRFPDAEPIAMEEAIAQYVETELSKHPNVEGVLIKAAGDVSVGIVEMAKRGVASSDMARERPLYIGVQEGK